MPMETRHDLEHTTERLTEGFKVPMEMGSFIHRNYSASVRTVKPPSLQCRVTLGTYGTELRICGARVYPETLLNVLA